MNENVTFTDNHSMCKVNYGRLCIRLIILNTLGGCSSLNIETSEAWVITFVQKRIYIYRKILRYKITIHVR